MGVSFKYGTKNNIESANISNGTFYVSTDEEKLYVDLKDKRINFFEELTNEEIDSIFVEE